MYLVRISNPVNESEFVDYVVVGPRPVGSLLRKAMWAVGRRYVIDLFETGIFIGMHKYALEAPKVTVGELLDIYSKLKYYKMVTVETTKPVKVRMQKEFTYPEGIRLVLQSSTLYMRAFLRIYSNEYTTVDEKSFIKDVNKQLCTDFHFGRECWHTSLAANETILVADGNRIVHIYDAHNMVKEYKVNKVLI